jgi:hypothetical protein
MRILNGLPRWLVPRIVPTGVRFLLNDLERIELVMLAELLHIGVNQEIGDIVGQGATLLTIPDEWKEKFLAQIELWQNEEGETRQRQVDRIKTELAALNSKVDRLNTAFTEGGLELAEFKELKNPLIVQKAVLEQQLAKTERGEVSPIEPLKNLVLEANQAEKWVWRTTG